MSAGEPEEVRILGSLRSENGRGVVRIEDRIDSNVNDVWSALTEPLRRAQWMGEVDGELCLGGEFRQRVFASGWEGSVRVDAFKAPSLLRLTQTADEARVPVIEVTATLSTDDNMTALVLEARGMPLDLLFAYGAGWQIHIEDLAAYLDGRERRDADSARWESLEAIYQDLATNVT